MKKKILIVDDDDDILFFLKYSLEKNDYLVSTYNDPINALEKINKTVFDLIILDVMMPNMTGLELCQKIRQSNINKNTLITFLSAKGDDLSIIEGLELGADDYISKPIKVDVLIKKIDALTRRLSLKSNLKIINNKITIDDDITLDTINYTLIYNSNSKKQELTKKEYDILILFLSDKENTFSRKDIFDKIWGDNYVSEGTLDVHIKKLRDKLNNKYITTKKGLGYIFIKN